MRGQTSLMTVRVKCPKCGKELSAPDELLGKVAMCPRCRNPFPVARSAAPTTATIRTEALAALAEDEKGVSSEAAAEPPPDA